MSTSRKSLNDAKVTKSDLKRMKSMRDEDIDYSDIPATDAAFWKSAELRLPEAPKEAVTMRIDKEIVDWFRAMGKGHTTRMSAVLRHYYEAHKSTQDSKS